MATALVDSALVKLSSALASFSGVTEHLRALQRLVILLASRHFGRALPMLTRIVEMRCEANDAAPMPLPKSTDEPGGIDQGSEASAAFTIMETLHLTLLSVPPSIMEDEKELLRKLLVVCFERIALGYSPSVRVEARACVGILSRYIFTDVSTMLMSRLRAVDTSDTMREVVPYATSVENLCLDLKDSRRIESSCSFLMEMTSLLPSITRGVLRRTLAPALASVCSRAVHGTVFTPSAVSSSGDSFAATRDGLHAMQKGQDGEVVLDGRVITVLMELAHAICAWSQNPKHRLMSLQCTVSIGCLLTRAAAAKVVDAVLKDLRDLVLKSEKERRVEALELFHLALCRLIPAACCCNAEVSEAAISMIGRWKGTSPTDSEVDCLVSCLSFAVAWAPEPGVTYLLEVLPSVCKERQAVVLRIVTGVVQALNLSSDVTFEVFKEILDVVRIGLHDTPRVGKGWAVMRSCVSCFSNGLPEDPGQRHDCLELLCRAAISDDGRVSNAGLAAVASACVKEEAGDGSSAPPLICAVAGALTAAAKVDSVGDLLSLRESLRALVALTEVLNVYSNGIASDCPPLSLPTAEQWGRVRGAIERLCVCALSQFHRFIAQQALHLLSALDSASLRSLEADAIEEAPPMLANSILSSHSMLATGHGRAGDEVAHPLDPIISNNEGNEVEISSSCLPRVLLCLLAPPLNSVFASHIAWAWVVTHKRWQSREYSDIITDASVGGEEWLFELQFLCSAWRPDVPNGPAFLTSLLAVALGQQSTVANYSETQATGLTESVGNALSLIPAPVWALVLNDLSKRAGIDAWGSVAAGMHLHLRAHALDLSARLVSKMAVTSEPVPEDAQTALASLCAMLVSQGPRGDAECKGACDIFAAVSRVCKSHPQSIPAEWYKGSAKIVLTNICQWLPRLQLKASIAAMSALAGILQFGVKIGVCGTAEADMCFAAYQEFVVTQSSRWNSRSGVTAREAATAISRDPSSSKSSGADDNELLRMAEINLLTAALLGSPQLLSRLVDIAAAGRVPVERAEQPCPAALAISRACSVAAWTPLERHYSSLLYFVLVYSSHEHAGSRACAHNGALRLCVVLPDAPPPPPLLEQNVYNHSIVGYSYNAACSLPSMCVALLDVAFPLHFRLPFALRSLILQYLAPWVSVAAEKMMKKDLADWAPLISFALEAGREDGAVDLWRAILPRVTHVSGPLDASTETAYHRLVEACLPVIIPKYALAATRKGAALAFLLLLQHPNLSTIVVDRLAYLATPCVGGGMRLLSLPLDQRIKAVCTSKSNDLQLGTSISALMVCGETFPTIGLSTFHTLPKILIELFALGYLRLVGDGLEPLTEDLDVRSGESGSLENLTKSAILASLSSFAKSVCEVCGPPPAYTVDEVQSFIDRILGSSQTTSDGVEEISLTPYAFIFLLEIFSAAVSNTRFAVSDAAIACALNADLSQKSVCAALRVYACCTTEFSENVASLLAALLCRSLTTHQSAVAATTCSILARATQRCSLPFTTIQLLAGAAAAAIPCAHARISGPCMVVLERCIASDMESVCSALVPFWTVGGAVLGRALMDTVALGIFRVDDKGVALAFLERLMEGYSVWLTDDNPLLLLVILAHILNVGALSNGASDQALAFLQRTPFDLSALQKVFMDALSREGIDAVVEAQSSAVNGSSLRQRVAIGYALPICLPSWFESVANALLSVFPAKGPLLRTTCSLITVILRTGGEVPGIQRSACQILEALLRVCGEGPFLSAVQYDEISAEVTALLGCRTLDATAHSAAEIVLMLDRFVEGGAKGAKPMSIDVALNQSSATARSSAAMKVISARFAVLFHLAETELVADVDQPSSPPPPPPEKNAAVSKVSSSVGQTSEQSTIRKAVKKTPAHIRTDSASLSRPPLASPDVRVSQTPKSGPFSPFSPRSRRQPMQLTSPARMSPLDEVRTHVI